VPGDLLDVVLVLAVLLFAVSGYRQGFVVGVLSFTGFLGGGVLGAELAPAVTGWSVLSGLPRAAVGLAVVFLCATAGQLLAGLLGGALRRRIVWRPARQLDAVGGALVSSLSLLLILWLLALAVASSPYPELASLARRSAVVGAVDAVVPAGGRQLFSSFRDVVDERGYPEVFDTLRPTDVREVEPPDPELAGSPAVQASRASVVKITGVATVCRKRVEGTGFVFAPERVMTNAHVVAGVDEPTVQAGDRRLDAWVVLFDPVTDVAVLAVPGLDRPSLPFAAEPAETGDDAVVVGYPQDGPFRPDSARVRGRIDARGSDIYGEDEVVREVYALRGRVRPGNSGGPLLTLSGEVAGVVFAAAADQPEVGYALTAREVSEEAALGRTAERRVSAGRCE
jgi:S1-C subfamily serine protease